MRIRLAQLLNILVLLLFTGGCVSYPIESGPIAITWGGESTDTGKAVEVDTFGNIYVAGTFGHLVDFDPGEGESLREANGGLDSFLCKYDPDMNLLWVTTWGGNARDEVTNLTVDPEGFIYVSGYVHGPGSIMPEYDFGFEIPLYEQWLFMAKFDPDGVPVLTLAFPEPHGFDSVIMDVAVDADGSIFITGGCTGDTDLDPDPNAYARPVIHTESAEDDRSAFVAKYSAEGELVWLQSWAAALDTLGTSLVIDPDGGVYVAGTFLDQCDFDPGIGEELYRSLLDDISLSKFDSDGEFQWVKIWSGGGVEDVTDMAMDDSGVLYITGRIWGNVDFDPGDGELILETYGKGDVFLVKASGDGTVIWARNWDGKESDVSHDLAVDRTGNVYVTGYANHDSTPASPTEEPDNPGDILLLKYSPDGDLTGEYLWGLDELNPMEYIDTGYGVAVDSNGNVFVTGCFGGTVDFYPGPKEEWHTSEGRLDAFLARFTPEHEKLFME